MMRWDLQEHLALGKYVARWLLLATPLGLGVGSASAFFLWSLEWVTLWQRQQPNLFYLAPLAGICIVLLYRHAGGTAERGTNLLLEEIHAPGAGVPRRMAPLVLVTTLLTHLVGGSAGREGTAVQMGGSLAATMAGWLRLQPTEFRTLLLCGMAAGFAGVFGTPLAATIFVLEVLLIGRLSYEALIPCLIASLVGDWACSAWGMEHTHYHLGTQLLQLAPGSLPQWGLVLKAGLAAVIFGLVSAFFAELTHALHTLWQRIPLWWLRPVAGASCLIVLVSLLGTRDYLGLGVSSPDPGAVTIVSSFHAGGADAWSWFWKLLFTAITLSCGFKGGEVTPLFFIGATLGHSLALILGAPIELFAALGFIGVFAGATNTPLACTVMGMELFGAQYTPYYMVACFLAYLASGHRGIYGSQRLGDGKLPGMAPSQPTLSTARSQRSPIAWPLRRKR